MEKKLTNTAYLFIKYIFFCSLFIITLLSFGVIISPEDVRGVESNIIYAIQLILNDNSTLYQNPEAVPFNITQYSPLYYLLNDSILTALNIKSTDFYSIRICTRILSAIFLLVTSGFIFQILFKQIKASKTDSLLFTSIFIIICFPWFLFSRTDVLVPFFFIIALYLVISYTTKKGIVYPILIGSLLFLGIASKLNMVAFLPVFGIFFLINRYWKMIILSTVSFFTTGFLFYYLMNVFGYDLTFMKENIIDGINNGYDVLYASRHAFNDFFAYYTFFILSLFLLIIYNLTDLIKFKKDSIACLLLILNAVALPFSLFSALKIGSTINYFNESLLCMLLLFAFILNAYHKDYNKLYKIGLMILGINIVINHSFFYGPRLYHNFKPEKAVKKEEIKIKKLLASNLNRSYFYSDNKNICLSFHDNCILVPWYIHNTTFKRNVFDYHKLQDLVDTGKFKYIISEREITNLYGISVADNFTLNKDYKHHFLYELNSYKNKLSP